MQYSCEISIDLPRERVIELFDNPDNLSQWQPTLKFFEHFEGELGKPGAKSRLIYNERGRELEMIETILVRNMPDEFSGTYQAKGVFNTVKNIFYEQGENQTRWVLDTEFEFSGMMKLMGFFMRGAFPKETAKGMRLFKEFAEGAS